MKEDNWEPKNGDWAVITTLNSIQGRLTGIVGHVFQIDYIRDDGNYKATDETTCIGRAWPLDSIRKAELHEIHIKYRPKLSKEQKNNILKLIKEI